jgi:hypothetical protein
MHSFDVEFSVSLHFFSRLEGTPAKTKKKKEVPPQSSLEEVYR